jgi:hypothetical protein
MHKTVYSCLVAAALTSFSSAAIVWQTPKNVTDDSDVSLNGQLERAYTFTGTRVGETHTINTVGFVRSNSTVVSGTHRFSVTGPSTGLDIGASDFTAGGAYAGTTNDYRAILAAAMRATGGTIGAPSIANDEFYNAFTFTLQGLTVGNSYEIQVWFSDSRNVTTAYNGFAHLTDGNAGSAPTGPEVDYNVGDVSDGGGLGQYVIGTFVATSDEESFTVTTKAAEVNNVALMNAYQLRVIPEPSSLLLIAGGTLAGMTRRRR